MASSIRPKRKGQAFPARKPRSGHRESIEAKGQPFPPRKNKNGDIVNKGEKSRSKT